MRALPNKAGSIGGGSFTSQDSDFESSSDGWECDLDLSFDLNIESKLIKEANKRILLSNIFSKYNIFFEQIYSATGWTHKCRCPFKDHNDNSPSFGYNSNENIFNCFGCHRGGGPVEFISAMESRPKIEVAKNFLKNSASKLDNISLGNVVNFDFYRFQNLLFEYADFLRIFKNKYNNSDQVLSYAKSVTWNLDVYLSKHVPFDSVVLDDLEARIIKIKQQIELFEEVD